MHPKLLHSHQNRERLNSRWHLYWLQRALPPQHESHWADILREREIILNDRAQCKRIDHLQKEHEEMNQSRDVKVI